MLSEIYRSQNILQYSILVLSDITNHMAQLRRPQFASNTGFDGGAQRLN
jgi:hypothetical protein